MKKALTASALVCAGAFAQPVPVTVADTIRNPVNGGLFNGSVDIIPQPTYRGGSYFAALPTTVSVQAGAFSVTLQPTTDAMPAGSSYSVRYRSTSGATWTRYWLVPTTPSTTTIAAVETAAAPATSLRLLPAQITAGSAGQCLISDGSSTSWGPCGAGGSGGNVGFRQAITGATSVSIAAGTHQIAGAVVVDVYDASGLVVEPGQITVDGNNNVTVTFATAQTGTVRILGSIAQYSTTFTLQTLVSIPAAAHLIRSNSGVSCRDASGNVVQTGTVSFTSAVVDSGGVTGPSADVSISFAVPQSGRCIVLGA